MLKRQQLIARSGIDTLGRRFQIAQVCVGAARLLRVEAQIVRFDVLELHDHDVRAGAVSERQISVFLPALPF